jgi:hypothetical protein
VFGRHALEERDFLIVVMEMDGEIEGVISSNSSSFNTPLL